MGVQNNASGVFQTHLQPLLISALSEKPYVGGLVAPVKKVESINFAEPVVDQFGQTAKDPDATKELDYDAPNPELSLSFDFFRGVTKRYGGGAVTVPDMLMEEYRYAGFETEQAAVERISDRVKRAQHLLACTLLNTAGTFLTSATGLGAVGTDPSIDIVDLILAQLNTDVTLNGGAVSHALINQTTAIKLLKTRALSPHRGFAGKASGGSFESQGRVVDSMPMLVERFKGLLGVDLLIDDKGMNISGTGRYGIDDNKIIFVQVDENPRRASFIRTYAKNPATVPAKMATLASVFSARESNPNRTIWWSETAFEVSSPMRTGANAKNPNGKQFTFTG